MFELEGGIVAQVNSSWCTRVRRDDLATFHVDGTHGSAVAGLTRWGASAQARIATPKPVWNPDVPQTIDFRAGWQEVPDNRVYENGFKTQWQDFIRHLYEDAPWDYTFLSGAKGVQLAELGYRSWRERRWVGVPELAL